MTAYSAADDQMYDVALSAAPGRKQLHWKQVSTGYTWKRLVRGLTNIAKMPTEKTAAYGLLAGLLVDNGSTECPTDGCTELHKTKLSVAYRSLITLDCDEVDDDFVDRVKAMGWSGLLFTSHSHGMPGKGNRYRLILRPDRQIENDEYESVCLWVIEKVGGTWHDYSTTQFWRTMYMPSTPGSDPNNPFQSWRLEGGLIDVDAAYMLSPPMPQKAAGQSSGPGYDGLDYNELEPWQQEQATEQVDLSVSRLRFSVGGYLAGEVDQDKYDGWDNRLSDVAWRLACIAMQPWNDFEEEDARAAYESMVPWDSLDTGADEEERFRSKLDRALEKAASAPVSQPPWAGLSAVEDVFDDLPGDDSDDGPGAPVAAATPVDELPAIPAYTDDARIADWMVRKGLGGNWCWAAGLGWHHWTGKRWKPHTDEALKESMRKQAVKAYARGLQAELDAGQVRGLRDMLDARKIGRVATLMRGAAQVEAAAFDRHPDLLNCWNGVVDLRTGELLEHDKGLYLTKITRTPYVAGARHADWTQVLQALDPDVMAWMQLRFGQGITGRPVPDDAMPIGQGGGSNGKSTLLGGLFRALGNHMVQVPEKLLRANPNEHPTELMTLRGTRLAVVDETPEAAQLNVGRLKAMLGTAQITARSMRQDFVTWETSHSLMVMTNYRPNIVETDHGTWRRLALVVFDKKFPPQPMFRDRVLAGKEGRAEAALAWAVEGAIRVYANPGSLYEYPARVVKDTAEWRSGTDMVMAYLEQRVVIDPNVCIGTSDLRDDFNEWMAEQGQRAWSHKLFAARFGGHDSVSKEGIVTDRTRDITGMWGVLGPIETQPAQPVRIWSGIRLRVDSDYTD